MNCHFCHLYALNYGVNRSVFVSHVLLFSPAVLWSVVSTIASDC